jgi:hypothetical protein
MMDQSQLESRVSRVEYQVDGVQAAIQKMDTKLDLIVSQVNKITILEINHQQHKETFARAFKRIEDLEEKNNQLATVLSSAKGGAGMFKWLMATFGGGLIALIVYAISMAGKV